MKMKIRRVSIFESFLLPLSKVRFSFSFWGIYTSVFDSRSWNNFVSKNVNISRWKLLRSYTSNSISFSSAKAPIPGQMGSISTFTHEYRGLPYEHSLKANQTRAFYMSVTFELVRVSFSPNAFDLNTSITVCAMTECIIYFLWNCPLKMCCNKSRIRLSKWGGESCASQVFSQALWHCHLQLYTDVADFFLCNKHDIASQLAGECLDAVFSNIGHSCRLT